MKSSSSDMVTAVLLKFESCEVIMTRRCQWKTESQVLKRRACIKARVGGTTQQHVDDPVAVLIDLPHLTANHPMEKRAGEQARGGNQDLTIRFISSVVDIAR